MVNKNRAIALLIAVLCIFAAMSAGCKKEESYYDKKIGIFARENKTAKDIDIVFLGDSLTDFYNVKEYFPSYKVLNRGIAGDTTDGLLKRLEVSVYKVKPKVATLLIGINNITTMFRDYEDILKALKENIPDAKIVVISLLPTNKACAGYNELIAESNKNVKTLAEKYDCVYADLHALLTDAETGMAKDEYTVDDGLHISVAGYEVITEYLSGIFSNLI